MSMAAYLVSITANDLGSPFSSKIVRINTVVVSVVVLYCNTTHVPVDLRRPTRKCGTSCLKRKEKQAVGPISQNVSLGLSCRTLTTADPLDGVWGSGSATEKSLKKYSLLFGDLSILLPWYLRFRFEFWHSSVPIQHKLLNVVTDPLLCAMKNDLNNAMVPNLSQKGFPVVFPIQIRVVSPLNLGVACRVATGCRKPGGFSDSADYYRRRTFTQNILLPKSNDYFLLLGTWHPRGGWPGQARNPE